MEATVTVQKPLGGLLWFGTAGAALILGGIVSLLAANWHTMPLVVQIVVAVVPLFAAWAGYLLFLRRGIPYLGVEEVLGTGWTGAVVCSVALLGRILQLSSSTFAFCIVMTLLLLPVVYAVRSTLAWVSCLGFAIATAFTSDEVFGYSFGNGYTVLFLLAGAVLMAPRLVGYWRQNDWYALGQRWLGALAAVAFTICLMVAIEEWLDVARVTTRLLMIMTMAFPLAIGAMIERRQTPRGRPLCLLGMGCLGWFALLAVQMSQEQWFRREFNVTLWDVIGALALVTVSGRWTLRNEGVFLLLLPLMSFALWLESPWLITFVPLLVGTVVITYGVRTGKRSLANEGLVFALAAGWCAFTALKADLMLQGILLIVGGVTMVALNVMLAKLAKGGRHA